MRIIVSREYGNRSFTMGTLYIEGQNFSCRTLERKIPDNWKGMKNFVALPEGEYDLCGEIVMDTLKETLRVSTTGTYRKACFTDKNLNEMSAGSIQLCRDVDTKRGFANHSAEIFEKFLDLLEEYRHYGIMPWRFKRGCATLVIKKDPCFVYENVEAEVDDEENTW